MRKQVHKKTVIRDGREETIVTEDTNIEQDNEGPEELQDSMQRVIDQFIAGEAEPEQTSQQNTQIAEWCHKQCDNTMTSFCLSVTSQMSWQWDGTTMLVNLLCPGNHSNAQHQQAADNQLLETFF